MLARFWILIAALLGASGVTLGAYHAHGLRTMLEKQDEQIDVDKQMDNCATGVRYQMYHALAILGLGVIALHRCGYLLHLAGIFLVLGVLGFCGGLYVNVFGGPAIHWSIVPLGGLCLIVGWLLLGVGGLFAARDG